MIVGIEAPGASHRMLRGMLALLIDENVHWYCDNPRAPSIVQLGVRFRPDSPSDTVVLVSAPSIDRVASCGSAAAAMAAWSLARGHARTARVDLRIEAMRPGVAAWHAVAVLNGTTVWDPRTGLPH